ncbi:TPA: hypothetical protein IU311_001770 [Enterococcus faecalis]|nr:hypothetical protein [Enterococcus faecalis]KDE16887.1 hypothetical protein HMPREF2097_02107 [Enterococcus faecalis 918]MBU5496488.1 hypothetical protein [Enterococcus sp. S171_ASV_20]MBU5517937.1 hypothetical protein [Enterococcus sp. S163_ASV_20]MBU5526784.1 hypothetical protein [Enterococcus sp. S159_ASV_20]MBU5554170.1 hypothetical protein [Enterococcus sp. S157_ASV_20]MBU5559298.1 hypothetical protein [Enterococcus sp. S115_ASV_20]MBU5569272.1 hypothetical protein [Enterococcus sp. S
MTEILYRRISMHNKEFVIKAMLLTTLGILLFVFVMCLSRLEFFTATMIALIAMIIRVLWVNIGGK